MRKLHKTVLVAVMIGSLGLAGAGAASAHESGSDGDSRQCANHVENISFGLINIPNLNLPLLGSSSNQDATQQICNNGDDAVNANVAHHED
ncbi:hypothetical protein [Streptomyces sp. NPDC058291]|jgi:hypothetical protein|uniref:hypothetical protein n=1 Tax=Streptomyces sp. NPDC058291 TaxID=3346427 RepID=UPI0036EB178F